MYKAQCRLKLIVSSAVVLSPSRRGGGSLGPETISVAGEYNFERGRSDRFRKVHIISSGRRHRRRTEDRVECTNKTQGEHLSSSRSAW